jgi:hypothetical protein
MSRTFAPESSTILAALPWRRDRRQNSE